MKVKYGADRAVESGRGFLSFLPRTAKTDALPILSLYRGRIFLPLGDNHWILTSSDLILHG